jgi:UrcA family protein
MKGRFAMPEPMTFFTRRLPMIGMAVGAIGLGAFAAMAASPASAQPTGYYDDDAVTTLPGVTVEAPTTGRSSTTGAPIRTVSTSRVVHADDLDLRNYDDARILKHRIELAARDACDDLDARYPITDESSPPCYRNAVDRAMGDTADAVGFEPPGW